MVQAKVIQYRRGRKTQNPKHMLIEIPGIDSREKAEKFIDKNVEWTSPGKKILKGRIASSHGNSGVLRVIFESGLPGQAIGSKCEVFAHTNNEEKLMSEKRGEVKN